MYPILYPSVCICICIYLYPLYPSVVLKYVVSQINSTFSELSSLLLPSKAHVLIRKCAQTQAHICIPPRHSSTFPHLHSHMYPLTCMHSLAYRSAHTLLTESYTLIQSYTFTFILILLWPCSSSPTISCSLIPWLFLSVCECPVSLTPVSHHQSWRQMCQSPPIF